MGLRFIGPEAIPYLVLFSDQTLLTTEGVVGIWFGEEIHPIYLINQFITIHHR